MFVVPRRCCRWSDFAASVGGRGVGDGGTGEGTYVVIHVRSAEKPDAHVVRELHFVDISTVCLDVCSVVNIVVRVHQADVLDPVPDDFCVLGIGIVIRVPSESSTEVEKTAVCNGVLVVIAGEIWVYLPSESSHK